MKKIKISKEKDLYESTKYNNIKELINESIRKYENNVAFIIKNKGENEKDVTYTNITYKELGETINNLGTGLINLGLQDKKIAIIAPNRYEWAVSYLATVNGTGTVVPLDKSLPEDEIEMSLIRSKADCVIFDNKNREQIMNIKNRNKTLVKYFICMDNVENNSCITLEAVMNQGKQLIEKGDRRFIDAKIDNEAVRILIFTSGTTSAAKAVMLSHKNIVENIYALGCAEKIYQTDRNLAFLPLHHTFGSTGLLFFLSCGTSTAFCDGLRYIQANLKEYKITVFVCVPLLLEAMYKKINSAIEKQGKTKLIKNVTRVSKLLLKVGIDVRRKLFKPVLDQLGGHVRFIVSGAAGIDKNVAEGFNDLGILTVQGYGLTETSPVLTAEREGYIKYGSVGLPLKNVEIKIDNPNENGIGEIIARGPNVMLGYYENEEATKEVLKDGWFYTGDLGYIDDDGFIFITGRKKNVIVLKNGKNIYPEELELLISNLPYVLENMVFGYPKDDDLILSVKIVYNKDYVKNFMNDISEDELYDVIWKDIKQISNKLPNYKHIKKLFISEEDMIKTTTQKIKRFQEIDKILEADKNK